MMHKESKQTKQLISYWIWSKLGWFLHKIRLFVKLIHIIVQQNSVLWGHNCGTECTVYGPGSIKSTNTDSHSQTSSIDCLQEVCVENSRRSRHVELVVVDDCDTTCTVIATLRVVRVVVGRRLSKWVVDSLSHICAVAVSKHHRRLSTNLDSNSDWGWGGVQTRVESLWSSDAPHRHQSHNYQEMKQSQTSLPETSGGRLMNWVTDRQRRVRRARVPTFMHLMEGRQHSMNSTDWFLAYRYCQLEDICYGYFSQMFVNVLNSKRLPQT